MNDKKVARERAAVEIVPKWADIFDVERSEFVPVELIGAVITAIGTPKEKEGYESPEGGGLVIEYIPAGQRDKRRIVLGFNELGMWVEKGYPSGAQSG